MIKLSDDKNMVNTIRMALVDNNGYCPCKILKNENTKCICLEFREQEDGMCDCGLYIKEKEDIK